MMKSEMELKDTVELMLSSDYGPLRECPQPLGVG